ncbi:MAG: FG-GAP-like repeat-containing protein [bacterium]|nr:FG-GAP-like repeat-containing protein [bacterium]
MKAFIMIGTNAVTVLAFVVFMAGVPAMSQPFFEDVAAQLGISDNENCGNAFWYDFDGDGDLDLLRSAHYGSDTYLYRNDIGSFTRVSGIGLPANWDAGKCIPMDFDHDGDLDLITGCYHTRHQLLVNEGGLFADRTTMLGLPLIDGNRDLEWLDWNQDGWMDILLQTMYGWHLYRNDNGTHFTDITSQAQLPADDGAGFCLADIDLDSDLDMFATRLSGTGRFWLNVGDGVFSDRTVEAGLFGIPASCGCVWVDINHDKYPDLVTQDYGTHGIWLNQRNGTFVRMNVHGMEADFSDWPHGAWYSVADYDMDGLDDIYCARPGSCGGLEPNQLFHQDRQEGLNIWFTDVAPLYGMDVMAGGNSRWADFDGDGDMDLTLISVLGEPIHLWRNNLINHSNRLQVRVLGPNGEQDRWFSRVEVYPHDSSEVLRAAELSYMTVGCNGLNHYFVLDPNAAYDLRIYSASGETMTPEEYPQLSAVIPSQIAHFLTVRMGAATARGDEPVVREFRFDGAYPNPFNASTVIRYATPRDGHVLLSVYDVLGRHVTDLVNTSLTGGPHETAWNASGLASGVYLLRLRAENDVAVQKAMLLK